MKNKLEKNEKIIIKTNDDHKIKLPDKLYRIEATKEKEKGIIQYEDFKLIGIYDFDKIVNKDKIIVNLNFDTIKNAILRLKFNYDVDIYNIKIINIPLIDYMQSHPLPINLKNNKKSIPFLEVEYTYIDFYLKKIFKFHINKLIQFVNKSQNKYESFFCNDEDNIKDIEQDENSVRIKSNHFYTVAFQNNEIIEYIMEEFREKNIPDYFTVQKYGICGLIINFYYGK